MRSFEELLLLWEEGELDEAGLAELKAYLQEPGHRQRLAEFWITSELLRELLGTHKAEVLPSSAQQLETERKRGFAVIYGNRKTWVGMVVMALLIGTLVYLGPFLKGWWNPGGADVPAPQQAQAPASFPVDKLGIVEDLADWTTHLCDLAPPERLETYRAQEAVYRQRVEQDLPVPVRNIGQLFLDNAQWIALQEDRERVVDRLTELTLQLERCTKELPPPLREVTSPRLQAAQTKLLNTASLLLYRTDRQLVTAKVVPLKPGQHLSPIRVTVRGTIVAGPKLEKTAEGYLAITLFSDGSFVARRLGTTPTVTVMGQWDSSQPIVRQIRLQLGEDEKVYVSTEAVPDEHRQLVEKILTSLPQRSMRIHVDFRKSTQPSNSKP